VIFSNKIYIKNELILLEKSFPAAVSYFL